MKKRLGKKGLSDVVVSLIMILLVLVAISVVWVVVSGILKSSSEEADISGLMINMKITEVLYDNTQLNIKISREPGKGDLTGVVFYLEGTGKSAQVEKKIPIEQLGEKTYNLASSSFSGSIAVNEIEKILVAPIYKLKSGKEKTGSVIDTAILSCTGSSSSTPNLKESVTTSFKTYNDYCGLLPGTTAPAVFEYRCINKIVGSSSWPCVCLDGRCTS